MAIFGEVNKTDKTTKEILESFIKDSDEFEGFVMVAFKKEGSEPVFIWNCNTHQIAVASVELSNVYRKFE